MIYERLPVSKGDSVELLTVAIATLAATFLAFLGYEFGPGTRNNLMLGAELFGVPIWIECSVLSVALLSVSVALTARIARSRNWLRGSS